MKKSPLQIVKEKFQSKEKLVDALISSMERLGGLSKEELRKKLLVQSNRKLLVLHQREELIKKYFGSRAKMIDALMDKSKGKPGKEDKDYRRHLESLSSGQLLDLARRLRLIKR